MIPQAVIRAVAQQESLQPTTVEKDYVLGWVLYGLARHAKLSRWVFKGGTCLKKCFFETYRFSEDLDFTVPASEMLSAELIETALNDACEWITTEAGIEFPRDRLTVEEFSNKQGSESFNARLGYIGPLRFTGQRMQRVRFDVTQRELLVDPPDHRAVFHRYDDSIQPAPTVACYSVNEILAEKTRALYERQGRARDVYDLVHISRNFRDEIAAARALQIVREKFAFKQLAEPTVDGILARVDPETLRRNWDDQLAHQLPLLPSVDSFVVDLREALAWWMEPAAARPVVRSLPLASEERTLPRQHFPAHATAPLGRGLATGASARAIDQLRFAARNRLLAEVVYHGVARVVEPYSIRVAQTGNTLLYVWELRRGSARTNQIKAYKLDLLGATQVLNEPFAPRYAIEL